MIVFAAPTGTFVVERIGTAGIRSTMRLPVVAYAYVQGGVAFPVCTLPFGGLTKYRALLTPDGYVTDRSLGEVFETLEEWETIADSDGYLHSRAEDPGTPVDTSRMAEGAVLPPNVNVTRNFAAAVEEEASADPVVEPVKEPVKTGRLPDKPAPKLEPRKFAKKSYWLGRTPIGPAFIFEVGPGEAVPAEKDTRFEKITGAEFTAKKGEGFLVLELSWQAELARRAGPAIAGDSMTDPEPDDPMDMI